MSKDTIRGYLKSLTFKELQEIRDGYDLYEAQGFIGQSVLRTHVEQYMQERNIDKTYTTAFMSMFGLDVNRTLVEHYESLVQRAEAELKSLESESGQRIETQSSILIQLVQMTKRAEEAEALLNISLYCAVCSHAESSPWHQNDAMYGHTFIPRVVESTSICECGHSRNARLHSLGAPNGHPFKPRQTEPQPSEVALSAPQAPTRYLPLATVLGQGVQVTWSAVEKVCAGNDPRLALVPDRFRPQALEDLFIGDFACLYFGRLPEQTIERERELMIAKMIHELGPDGVRFDE